MYALVTVWPKRDKNSCPPKTCLKVVHFNAFCFRCKIYLLPLNGSSGMHRKQNVEIAFGFKSDTAVFDFYLLLFQSPLIFSVAFLALFFFSFAANELGFISVGTVFAKASRIV